MFDTLDQALKTKAAFLQSAKVVIVDASEFQFEGAHRQALKVRKGNFDKLYLVIRFENGQYECVC